MGRCDRYVRLSKALLAFALAVLMTASGLPVSALAEMFEEGQAIRTEENTPLDETQTIQPSETIKVEESNIGELAEPNEEQTVGFAEVESNQETDQEVEDLLPEEILLDGDAEQTDDGEAFSPEDGLPEHEDEESAPDEAEVDLSEQASKLGLTIWTTRDQAAQDRSTKRLGDTVYLHYDIIDENYNKLDPSDYGLGNYIVNESFFDPSGNYIAGYSYSNSRGNWIRMSLQSSSPTGKWKAVVSISGAFSISCTEEFEVYDTVPSITTQPSSKTIDSGSTTSFSVSATGTHLKYQWYYRTPSGSSYSISGATSSSYSVTASADNSGRSYYCRVYNYGNELYSSSAQLTARYTISYSANGGGGAPSAQRKTHGYTLTLSSTKPTRSGYEFLGWSTNSSATYASYTAGSTYSTNGNATLYAVWKRPQYTVYFNANGGSVSTSSKQVTYGSTYGSLPTPVRDNYSFDGWYTSTGEGSRVYESTICYLASSQTLYAHWTYSPATTKPVIVLSQSEFTYNGKFQRPTITLKDGSKTLVQGTDYEQPVVETDAVNTKTYNILVRLKGNYAQYDSVTSSYRIVPASMSSVTVAAVSDRTYTGSAIKPEPQVKLGDVVLVKDVDYTFSYASNTNAGTATIKVTAKSKNLTGSKDSSFKIVQAAPTLKFASSSVSKKTSDSAFTNALTKTTDGTISFKTSNAGVAKVDGKGLVTIQGEGETTITATAAAGVNYKAGSASYVLKVTKSITYTVTYNTNGGTGAPSPQSKGKDVALTLSSIKPTKKYTVTYNANGGSVSPASKSLSCTFKSWNTKKDGSGTSYASGGSYKANVSITLYAQWTNPKVGALATPKRSGYSFVGWYTAATGGKKISDSTVVTGGMTLYAHWTDPYNLGDETYSFANYPDWHSKGGHCFGMSMTSSGYHNGLLDIAIIGGKANSSLYSFDDSAVVKKPICYYQDKQGDSRDGSVVAGGSTYLDGFDDIESDWKEVINYVKNHNFDNTGKLQIGYRGKYIDENGKVAKGGHAINFLRYKNVGGQDRIYAYDNNYPNQETYFYRNAKGKVLQAPVQTFDVSIDCIALRDVRTYFKLVKSFDATRAIYVAKDSANVQGYSFTYMEGAISGKEYVMYEIPESVNRVTIVPKEDYADFIYMDTEYSFGEVTSDTRGDLRFASGDEGMLGSDASFTIYEADEAKPTMTLSKSSYVYDGKLHKPSVTVKVGGVLLKQSSDYTVKYPSGMTNAGKYEIKVTLKGKYSGSVTKAFTIVKASQAITASNKSVAMGKTVALAAKRTKGSGKLTYKSSNTSIIKVNASGIVTPVKAGKAKVTITAASTSNWEKATRVVAVTVTKGTQPMVAKAVARSASAKALKSKAVAVARPMNVTKAQGKLSYAKASGAKCLSVNKKTGKVTVKKGTKKGIYKIKIKVTAAGTKNYKKGSKTVTCKVTVK